MTRNLIIVITYAVALVLIVINFVPIMRAVWKFIVLFKPFFMGIAVAFVLNRPCMAVERFLNKRLFKIVKSTCQRNSNYCYIFSGTFVDYADNKFYNTGTYKKYTSVFKQYGSIYR